jgi:hypothetical protein
MTALHEYRTPNSPFLQVNAEGAGTDGTLSHSYPVSTFGLLHMSGLASGGFDFDFSYSSRTHVNYSPALITVQPSISILTAKYLTHLLRCAILLRVRLL